MSNIFDIDEEDMIVLYFAVFQVFFRCVLMFFNVFSAFLGKCCVSLFSCKFVLYN